MNSQREAWVRDVLGEDVVDPKWPLVEQHLGCALPSELKEFYQDLDNLLSTPFEFVNMENGAEFRVETFCPVGQDAFHEFEGVEHCFLVAHDGRAGYYLIDPTEVDPHVALFSVDDSQVEATGLGLTQFLALARSSRVPSKGTD